MLFRMKIKFIYISTLCIVMLIFPACIDSVGNVNNEIINDNHTGEITVSTGAYGNQPDDLTGFIEVSDIIVEGLITEVHQSVWISSEMTVSNTANETAASNRTVTEIRTPYELKVTRILKGTNIPDLLIFTTVGGDIPGQLKVNYGNQAQLNLLEEGFQCLALLSRAPENAGAWSEVSPIYLQLAFKVSGSNLIGPRKVISIDEFMR